MTAPRTQWLAEPLPAAVERALARLQETADVQHVAVMPDVHLAEDVCVGTVVATASTILPAAVGGDIGCGMAAARFPIPAEVVQDERVAAGILHRLYASVPCLRHPVRAPPVLPDALDPGLLSAPQLQRRAERDGRLEFGTVGRGNHFIELQSDEEGRLWVMIHSGSRVMGPTIRDHHLANARVTSTGLAALDAVSLEGAAYLSDLDWALRYAQHSRQRMLEAVGHVVEEMLGVSMDSGSILECQHNHVRRELHGGRGLWVHRKGAMPADCGVQGVIPGSMGSASFHVEGRGHGPALCSSSHGAGRAMSRSEARRSISLTELHRQMRGVMFDHRHAAHLREEAPGAYKDVSRVMRAQSELVRIVRKLRPILSFKAV